MYSKKIALSSRGAVPVLRVQCLLISISKSKEGEIDMVSQSDYIRVKLLDGTIFEGEIVKVGSNHIVIDDVRAFEDWVFIELCNIVEIEYC